MKKTIISFFTICMIVGISNNLNAQNTATESADASATIITPITITNTADLNFGDIIDGTGTVTLSPAGVRTTDYQAFSGTQAGTVTAASFGITGQGDYTYSITLPTSDVTLTETGSATMIVNAFVSDPSGTGTLSSGAGIVSVGATLNVVSGQTAGVYTGTFDVTVAYN
ncbi:DUF4402 domain-containing protein [Polaribacter glomeratus]|uniref:DUF4402 domain-containing protein n=1 Tax=Polaribacter glomeratus TaxID=102 RepID=A0A2S7WG42_9FLAO|nr:DUF4402 domain-containing protein [Polaribacter glomeratus]PQJ76271.1 hypothetical protein BTO16_10130 [Polaribacter glomeratus]TXD63813.1 DUF4402 domain-containing protein [Polaribacter glomeratus]